MFYAALVVAILLILLALAVRPVRKAIGLLLIILGILECLTVVYLIIGIPSILIGGILLFA
jgi:hypothetical protein